MLWICPLYSGESESPLRRISCDSSLVKQVQQVSCLSFRGSLMNEKRWKSFSPSCTSGCSGLHPVGGDAVASDGFGQVVGGRFGTSSTGQHLAAYVHQSVEESACGQDDTLRLEGHSPASGDTCHFAVLYQEFFHGVLPNM